MPVADPNIFSMSQRITLAQTQLQIATSNPQLHNMYQIYRNMYNAIGVKNIDAVLPPPAPMAPMDPSMEHINAMAMKPFQAFPGQHQPNTPNTCLLYTSPSPRDGLLSRMPSSA